jgi:hypothetical protein
VHRLLVASGIPMPTNRSYFGFVISRIRADWARGSDHGARAAIPPRSEA